ncbi:MAG: hypothetical protein C4550_05200 [Nitrospiraceae bacterium]|nr:MAG: hypothetical protein C4550_05200 [Nitrospiraceae bacterium]
MDLGKLMDTEYQKCIGLLAELIGLDADTEEKIYRYFQSIGITNFFLHLELLDLPHEISEKLKSIKSIIEMFDEERGASIT